MQYVTIQKEDLRRAIEENLDSYRAAYDLAREEYKAAIVHALKEKIADARAGRYVDHVIRLPRPVDHTDDYEMVLQMIDMSINDEVELAWEEFAAYVRDDWDWKEKFVADKAKLSRYNLLVNTGNK